MRVITLALAVLALSVTALKAEINPIYARLKAFRTYLTITNVRPQAHHFYVWFQDIEPCLCQISANTTTEMDALTEDDLHLSFGAFGVPPETVDPVPAELAPLADAMLARVKVLHPDATRYKISYAGNFRTVSVEEILPHALLGDPTHRAAARVEANLKVMADGSVAGTYGFAMAGHGLLVHPAFPDEYTALPRFVDAKMPAELEGTSLLYTPIFGRSPSYEAAYQQLCRAVVAAADTIQAGTYQNPIEQVLAGQGDTALPPHFSTLLKFSIQTYARTPDFQDQVGETASFNIYARSALAGPVSQTVSSGQTGLTYTLTVDLKALTMSVHVVDEAGHAVDARYPLKSHSETPFVTEGDSAAMSGWIHAEIPQEQHGLELPGHGGFTSIDVYPESSVWPSLINLPEGAVMSGKGVREKMMMRDARRAAR